MKRRVPRKTIPEETQTSILLKSRRRCCLCFWLHGIDEVQKGQIAHLDGDNTNFAEDNLSFLCLPHHDDYDSSTRLSKGLRQTEVRHWRDELYREMVYRFREDVENQRTMAVYNYLEQVMSDLLKAMRYDLKQHPLWRNVAIRGSGLVDSIPNLLAYGTKDILDLRLKMDVLANHGLVKRQDHFYQITEALAAYLRTS